MEGKNMGVDRFLYLDPVPQLGTNMGSIAKKRDVRSLEMCLVPRTCRDNGAPDQCL